MEKEDIASEESDEKSSLREQADDITPAAVKEETHVERKTCMTILKANPLYSEVSKIFHWRDPVRSGLLFGIANLFYILLSWGEYSVVTLTSYLLLSLLLVCLGYANYVVFKASWLQGKKVENPFKEKFKNQKFHVTREAIDKHVDTILDLINLTIDKYRDVFYCSDNLVSLKYAFYFYLAATIGDWFSGITLLYLGTLASFIWPRLYEEKKTEIDHWFNIALTEGDKYLQLALSKLPPAIAQRFPQLKPKAS